MVPGPPLLLSSHQPRKLLPCAADICDLSRHLAPGSNDFVNETESLREVALLVAGRRDAAVESSREPTVRALIELLPRLIAKRSIRFDDLIQLHAALAPDVARGTRREYVRCGGLGVSTAIYVPPPPITLNGYMKDIVEYFNHDAGSHWLTKSLALAVQILVVHPFLDGNGRLARAVFAVAAARASGYRKNIVLAMDRLWSNECLLIHAINDTVLYGEGWRDSKLGPFINSIFVRQTGFSPEQSHA